MTDKHVNTEMAALLTHPMEANVILDGQKNSVNDYIGAVYGSLHVKAASIPDLLLSSSAVSETASPRLDRIYSQVLERLEAPERYPLFVSCGHELKAESFACEPGGYAIRVSGASVEEFSDDELAALLGMEVGHILLHHTRHREMLSMPDQLAGMLPLIGQLASQRMMTFFGKWMIASAFSADRAALIASRSHEAVVSVLLRQMGADPAATDLQQVLRQGIVPMPDKPGLYFIRLAQSMPSYGNIQRIREVTAFVHSPAFREAYPDIVPMRMPDQPASNDAPGKLRTVMTQQLKELNRRARAGDALARAAIGEGYLTGQLGLPRDAAKAVHWLTAAARGGNAHAMYLLGTCMLNGSGCRQDEKRACQLFRAAASRGDPQAAAAVSRCCPVHENASPAVRSACQSAAREMDGGDVVFNPTNADQLRSRFFMPADETIHAAAISRASGSTGVIIAETGIYGQISAATLPFCLPWSEFLSSGLRIAARGGRDWLVSGSRILCAAELNNPRSMGSLLLRLSRV